MVHYFIESDTTFDTTKCVKKVRNLRKMPFFRKNLTKHKKTLHTPIYRVYSV